MIELLDTLPDVNVQPAEYKRLLGYPRHGVLSGRARELADWARAWYAKNGRPWVYARQADSLQLAHGVLVIDGVTFNSREMLSNLQQAKTGSVILAAVSAGPQVADEAQRLWRDGKPDEYFFLEIYGSAVVEHLVMMTGARLCAWADGQGLAVLPHYSPGYPQWDISEQARLLELIKRTRENHTLPSTLDVMESGMLRPKKSLLAVFGLTAHTDDVKRLTDLVPCQNCSLNNCPYRRVPYAPTARPSEVAASALPGSDAAPVHTASASQLDHAAKYQANSKALRRWAEERLELIDNPDGTTVARFHYEGTTCRNMGRQILFDYRVKLSAAKDGYLILEQLCGPAPGDVGHTFMCRYMTNAEHLMVAIDLEKPLLGRPLNDVLTWDRKSGADAAAAGCYCEPASRRHKWGLVLETIHYALVQREKAASTSHPAPRSAPPPMTAHAPS